MEEWQLLQQTRGAVEAREALGQNGAEIRAGEKQQARESKDSQAMLGV
jgi:hypothetical protein